MGFGGTSLQYVGIFAGERIDELRTRFEGERVEQLQGQEPLHGIAADVLEEAVLLLHSPQVLDKRTVVCEHRGWCLDGLYGCDPFVERRYLVVSGLLKRSGAFGIGAWQVGNRIDWHVAEQFHERRLVVLDFGNHLPQEHADLRAVGDERRRTRRRQRDRIEVDLRVGIVLFEDATGVALFEAVRQRAQA